MSDMRFSEAVSTAIGNYVYRLIDPRDGETFYVGRGTGNRVFDHMKAAVKLADGEDADSLKLSRINAIRDCYLDVLHVIHRHGIPAEAVNEVEAALIDAYSGLSNLQLGLGSNDRRPMNAKQIIDKYDLPKITPDPEHKLLVININRLENRSDVDEVYNQVRFSWRLNPERANKADFVLAVVRGVVVGAFEANFWKRATVDNFPDIAKSQPDRFAFDGIKAPAQIWDFYVGERGKQIDHEGLRHSQNPIRYWQI